MGLGRRGVYGAALSSPIIVREIIRAGEWWEYKLVPIVAVFYATTLLAGAPLIESWKGLLILLAALAPGATYVSVINDLTDRRDDLIAGKPNQFAHRSPVVGGILVAVSVSIGLLFCYRWRHDTQLLTAYLLAWLAFSLYSLPPFRWKARGILGVLCDAAGSQLFPTLVAVLLATREAGTTAGTTWMAVTSVWALTHGLRGILWHQLVDLENDQKTGVRTFAQRHSPRLVTRLGTFVIFPIEVAALALMLRMLDTNVVWLSLAAYCVTIVLRLRWWRMNAVIVAPKPRYLIVLDEFYVVFLPLAILAAATLRATSDVVILIAHLILFPALTGRALGGVWKLARQRSHPT